MLDFLVAERVLSEALRNRMLGWRYSGFSVHNQVRVGEGDAEGRRKLAGTMLRAPMSLEKMTYDAESGTVIYRSKMHLGLKRNFQLVHARVARFMPVGGVVHGSDVSLHRPGPQLVATGAYLGQNL